MVREFSEIFISDISKSLGIKLTDVVSGGSEELGSFMSQCRKNSVRGKGIDKK